MRDILARTTIPPLSTAAMQHFPLVNMFATTKVAIVGVGLIGGSVGLALRKRGLAACVTGIGRNLASLEKAFSIGAVDKFTTDLEHGVKDADVVVIASPVDTIADLVCRTIAASNATLITDAGSTKASICHDIEGRLPGIESTFVGSHPLAGDHRTGPEYSRADLFGGRTVVVTPTLTTPQLVVERARRFWESLSAIVHLMSPEEHDEALAYTSHLPHIAASALVICTAQEYLPLTASGWTDTTRIAAGDADLWTQIFRQNAAAMRPALERLILQLQQMQSQIAAGEWQQLQEALIKAKRIRDALGN